MNRSVANNFSLFIIFLYAIAPFFGYLTNTFVGKNPSPFLLLLCLPAIYLLIFERGNVNLPVYVIFFFLFMVYTILSDKFIVGESIGFGYIRNNDLIGSFLILVVVESVIIPRKFYEIVYKITYAVIIIAFFVILIQQFYRSTFFVNPKLHSILLEWGSTESRLPSIYSWTGPLAELGLALFPVLGIPIEEMLRKDNKKFIALYILGIIIALLSKSRFILVNYFLLFFLIPVHKGLYMNIIVKYLIIGIFSLFVMYMGAKAVNFDVEEYVAYRLLDKDQGGLAHGSAATRILAFKIFAQLFPENPVWGKGMFHAFGEGENASRDIELMRALNKRSSQIHVGYLSLFYYYGIIGGIIYLMFLFSLTRKLYLDAKKTRRFAPLIGWIMFLTTNLTGVYFYITFQGIILAIFFNKYYKDQLITKENQ